MNNWLEQAREKLQVKPVEKDNHHLLFDARPWGAHSMGADVRGRIIAHGMNRVVHNLLHENESVVPVPEYHSLLHVYQNLPKGLDVYKAIDKYCVLLNNVNKHPKIHPIEVQLNNLSIEAIQNQVVYLREGRAR